MTSQLRQGVRPPLTCFRCGAQKPSGAEGWMTGEDQRHNLCPACVDIMQRFVADNEDVEQSR